MPHPPNTQLAMYADDNVLLAQSWRTDTIVRRLTHAMALLHRYFTKWKLRVNINKTVAMLFTKRRPATPPPLQFQHTVIPWSPHIRYLGLELDSKLLFTKHTLLNTRPLAFFSKSSPSSPVTQCYPLTTNSPFTNYWSAPYLPTPPPSGAIHRRLTIVIFNLFNPNVLESLVIIPDVPPSYTYTPFLTSNPFMSLPFDG